MFDGVDIIAPLTTPVIKYGHLNVLGIPLVFPKTGQVALDMKAKSLGEVLEILTRPCDFSGGLAGFQIDYLGKMRKAFPGRRVHWGWQSEGPVTTLWGLAGNEAMYGLYDERNFSKSAWMRCWTALSGIPDSTAGSTGPRFCTRSRTTEESAMT